MVSVLRGALVVSWQWIRRIMCSLAVRSVSCSVCANRRRLRCAIWAAALRTSSSWRCAAALHGLSACWVRCHCRACVTAPLMVASLIRGSLNRWLAAWCAWLCEGQLCVAVGFPLESSPLICLCPHGGGSSGSAPSTPDRLGRMVSGVSMCLRASHLATLVRNGSCSLQSWMHRFCKWAGTHAGRRAEL